MRSHFRQISDLVVLWAGHRVVPVTLIAFAAIWAAVGLSFSFPRQWFLLTNMVGTLIIFFILLLVQHSQNRDMTALHAKLDELIRSSEAGNHWIAAEKKDADAIEGMRQLNHGQTSETST
ncbi:low affinity iron permease family protein [Rhizobium leguminosarum]|uniref:low affinity iron permease family protein n=1 Tax=Rhizobium leguminosarum TaxID=384 RepID=UPI001A936C45|nr:low affinity iron permease family protein [Rhizobium leguminosarum]MBY5552565.1 low affinity iron permease family protein [Rhizobium leguminosarum]MBY5633974.1 low affinity iron permease family protein [Rhizobium leguminosarum]MBY5689231.1 low affinity iron permease family protein [Rhizobium leguminosarum]MBY5724344.1 low affinity iron permease family protein [Rhizobium leguminosarum]MBY5743624.1 low affinity iron permease family protein [Rhizobium leguminosarum]